MGDIDPTEVISVRKGEKVRDFRHQKKYNDATDLSPGRHALGKSNTSTRARAHGVVRRVLGCRRIQRGFFFRMTGHEIPSCTWFSRAHCVNASLVDLTIRLAAAE